MVYTKATKEGRLPVSRKPTRQEIEILKQSQSGQYQVDLNSLGVHSLVNELILKYNQNNDVGVIRSWLKRRKVEAQNQQLSSLFGLVTNIRENASDLVEFKAQLMSQQMVMGSRITAIIEEAKFAVDRQRQEQKTFIIRQAAEREQANLMLERLKHENEAARWQAEAARFEAEDLKQKARITELRGDLIAKIIRELSFAEINMKQVFVLIEMVKDASSRDDLFTADARWEQLKAEADKTQALADQEKTKADHERWKFEQDKKEPG